tara:strand:- start:10 stop:183 length:174 start_codon:yes stop_codon:yes gene_type:complete
MHFQVDNLNKFLAWLKECPYTFTISSMSGGFVHVKFFIPYAAPEEPVEELIKLEEQA